MIQKLIKNDASHQNTTTNNNDNNNKKSCFNVTAVIKSKHIGIHPWSLYMTKRHISQREKNIKKLQNIYVSFLKIYYLCSNFKRSTIYKYL